MPSRACLDMDRVAADPGFAESRAPPARTAQPSPRQPPRIPAHVRFRAAEGFGSTTRLNVRSHVAGARGSLHSEIRNGACEHITERSRTHKRPGPCREQRSFAERALEKNVVLADLGRFLHEGAKATLDELERRASTDEPDFVVIDSFKAIAELLHKESNARSRSVIISSDTASALKLAATRVRGHLSKPVPIDRLLATIKGLH